MAHRSRRKGPRVLANLSAAVIVLAFIWGAGLFHFANTIPEQVADGKTATDAIVVLTGGSERLRTGLDLLDGRLAEHLFVSGVYRGLDVQRLLAVAKRSAGDLGDKIGIGNAVNTAENAAETAAWMRREGYKSLRLVTAAYHMPRSLLEFQDFAPDLAVIPHPVFPSHVKQAEWWAWPGTASLIAGEYNKMIAAWIRHRVLNLIELAEQFS